MRSTVASILRNQEENGAFVASPDFAEYRYCWLRDGSFVAYPLDQVGEHHASARYHEWANRAIGGISALIDRAIDWHRQGKALHPDHMPPARFALDGSNVADDWPNFQIDGYGTWLWALGQHLLSTGQDAVPEESIVRSSGSAVISMRLPSAHVSTSGKRAVPRCIPQRWPASTAA